jgi:hypothetical protein
MKFRPRHLRQFKRFTRVRVLPFGLAFLVMFLGTNMFLASAAVLGMQCHGHAQSTLSSKDNSENPISKIHFHEHCQFCFAPALASGVPDQFEISRLTVTETLKLEPQHFLVFTDQHFKLAAPRAPPFQA